MAQNIVKKPQLDEHNPASALSGILKDDMAATNAVILKHMQSEVALIPQLAGYLIASGGKRIRPLLTLACTKICDGEMSRAHALAAAVEFIHTATLLHDDVVDESGTRRGQDAANIIFGNQASVLVGDFLFSRAFQLMVSDGSLDVLRVLSNASAVITEGEVLQLSHTGNLDTSMETYIRIITAKTAILFSAACEVGPLIAGCESNTAKAFAEFGLNLGIAFQIADDVLDYMADEKTLGKTPGDDFREGKITAPLLFALKTAQDNDKEFLQTCIQSDTRSDKDFAKTLEILQNNQSLQKTTDMAQTYAHKAQQALKHCPQNELTALLDELPLYTIQRKF
jgi:octaprenyl-diphosphate synthase